MVILGLGSNKGDRMGYLRQAVSLVVAFMSDLRESNVYETQALLPQGAPEAWNIPFLNMAIAGRTSLPPEALLKKAKEIENKLGRTSEGRWGPREIDVDILAMGDVVLNTPTLSIPHPELLNRDFALLPLCDLQPEWVYPVKGEHFGNTVSEIVSAKGFRCGMSLEETGIVRYAE